MSSNPFLKKTSSKNEGSSTKNNIKPTLLNKLFDTNKINKHTNINNEDINQSNIEQNYPKENIKENITKRVREQNSKQQIVYQSQFKIVLGSKQWKIKNTLELPLDNIKPYSFTNQTYKTIEEYKSIVGKLNINLQVDIRHTNKYILEQVSQLKNKIILHPIIVNRLLLGFYFYSKQSKRHQILAQLMRSHKWFKTLSFLCNKMEIDYFIAYYILSFSFFNRFISFNESVSLPIDQLHNINEILMKCMEFYLFDRINLISIYKVMLLKKKPSDSYIILEKDEQIIIKSLLEKYPFNCYQLQQLIVNLICQYWNKSLNKLISPWFIQELLLKLTSNKLQNQVIQYKLENLLNSQVKSNQLNLHLNTMAAFQPIYKTLILKQQINFKHAYQQIKSIGSLKSLWTQKIEVYLLTLINKLQKSTPYSQQNNISDQVIFLIAILLKMQDIIKIQILQYFLKTVLIKVSTILCINCLWQLQIKMNFKAKTIMKSLKYLTMLRIGLSTTRFEQWCSHEAKTLQFIPFQLISVTHIAQCMVRLVESIINQALSQGDLESVEHRLSFQGYNFDQTKSEIISFLCKLVKKFPSERLTLITLIRKVLHNLSLECYMQTALLQYNHCLFQIFHENSNSIKDEIIEHLTFIMKFVNGKQEHYNLIHQLNNWRIIYKSIKPTQIVQLMLGVQILNYLSKVKQNNQNTCFCESKQWILLFQQMVERQILNMFNLLLQKKTRMDIYSYISIVLQLSANNDLLYVEANRILKYTASMNKSMKSIIEDNQIDVILRANLLLRLCNYQQQQFSQLNSSFNQNKSYLLVSKIVSITNYQQKELKKLKQFLTLLASNQNSILLIFLDYFIKNDYFVSNFMLIKTNVLLNIIKIQLTSKNIQQFINILRYCCKKLIRRIERISLINYTEYIIQYILKISRQQWQHIYCKWNECLTVVLIILPLSSHLEILTKMLENKNFDYFLWTNMKYYVALISLYASNPLQQYLCTLLTAFSKLVRIYSLDQKPYPQSDEFYQSYMKICLLQINRITYDYYILKDSSINCFQKEYLQLNQLYHLLVLSVVSRITQCMEYQSVVCILKQVLQCSLKPYNNWYQESLTILKPKQYTNQSLYQSKLQQYMQILNQHPNKQHINYVKLIYNLTLLMKYNNKFTIHHIELDYNYIQNYSNLAQLWMIRLLNILIKMNLSFQVMKVITFYCEIFTRNNRMINIPFNNKLYHIKWYCEYFKLLTNAIRRKIIILIKFKKNLKIVQSLIILLFEIQPIIQYWTYPLPNKNDNLLDDDIALQLKQKAQLLYWILMFMHECCGIFKIVNTVIAKSILYLLNSFLIKKQSTQIINQIIQSQIYYLKELCDQSFEWKKLGKLLYEHVQEMDINMDCYMLVQWNNINKIFKNIYNEKTQQLQYK